MTRGYVCVTNKKQIVKVAYLQSDAYLSGYGLEILNAIIASKMDDFMEKQIAYNHEVYGWDEPSPDFSLDWIMRNKNNQDWDSYDFSEYGYLYSENTEVLKVYIASARKPMCL